MDQLEISLDLAAWLSQQQKVPGSSSFLSAPITKMSDDESKEPIEELCKQTLDTIIKGVAAKLQENPHEKRSNDGPSSSSAHKGE